MTIIKSIKTFARFHPDRLALVDDDISLTYGELEILSTNWALTFLQMGIQKNDRVMVCMKNSSRFLAVIVALEKLDATIMPMNYQLFQKDVKDICGKYDVKYVITELYFQSTFTGLGNKTHFVENLTIGFMDRNVTTASHLFEHYDDESEMIFFTSGSTGKPKGISLLKKSLNPTVLPDFLKKKFSVHLLVRPMFFRSHLTLAYNTILQGDTLVVSRSDDPGTIYQLLTANLVKQMTSGPTDLYELVNYMESESKEAPHSLKEVMTTGRALPDGLKERMASHFPRCDIIDFYGTSEIGAISSISKSEWKMKNRSSGKPEFFVDVIIMDETKGKAAPLVPGEICVKSKYAMKEYKFEKDVTAYSFVDGYIRTGDVGYLDEDGYLFIVGRKNEVINRGGFYFYPSELENSMLEIKEVQEVAVLPVQDDKWGQVPAAFVVLKESHQPFDELEMKEYLKTKLLLTLPAHKIPEYVTFLKEMPFNLGGKIDKPKLYGLMTNVATH
ncbi:class I adenylate-forming enzyme family protein [Rossellomorea sp. LjRoot5]|uniref:class I adenylate-forming enzyme family protein n=1 Tax=Rossellomorea sp. LjRoot5 TaxID=3342331 RepID=UPI003ECF21B7